MNNSERGKYYRQKHKIYEDGLEASIASLGSEVRHLQLFVRLRTELAAQASLAQRADSIVSRIYQIITQAEAGESTVDCSEPSTTPLVSAATLESSKLGNSEARAPSRIPSIFASKRRNHGRAGTPLWGRLSMRYAHAHFELRTFTISGDKRDDAPTIALRGVLHTQYSAQALIETYPHLLVRTDLVERLVDKPVVFPATLQFYFRPDGTLQRCSGDCDAVHGLSSTFQRLDDVRFVLDVASSSNSSIDDVDNDYLSTAVVTSEYCNGRVQQQPLPREPAVSARWRWEAVAHPDVRFSHRPVAKFSH